MVGYLGFFILPKLSGHWTYFFVYEISESGYVIGFNYIDEGVRSSYGRSSPGIVDTEIVAFFVLSSGKVYDEYFYDGYVKDSYG